jgi:hypothetical protein
MLDVETNHQIILLYFREGLSLRKIAQQLRISRDTVKARIVAYERFKTQPVEDQLDPQSAKSQYLLKGPAYDSSNRSKRRLTAEIIAIIDACLKENETRRYWVRDTISGIPRSVSTSVVKPPGYGRPLSGRDMRPGLYANLTGRRSR